MPDVHEANELSDTSRGSGAFGSTDEVTLYLQNDEEEGTTYFDWLEPVNQFSGESDYLSRWPNLTDEEFINPLEYFTDSPLPLIPILLQQAMRLNQKRNWSIQLWQD